MEVLTKAANILDISEYEVLSRAYAHWHGSDAPKSILQLTFSTYLKTQELPHWAKHYALQIIQAFEAELQREGEFIKLAWLLVFSSHIRFKNRHHLIA
ncbi:MAG: hypothetical protein AMJ53_07460 [Gammaproteobacteria bacterium SG8_11]|nr:MAG: hypothetical protein AMJ53_07460 [Gammaproteobacteria bacterium SG8_11]